jgi:hypothetical protein
MSKKQTFRNEDVPFGIANGKSQIPKYGICNLRSEIPSASEDSLLQVCPSLTFSLRNPGSKEFRRERAVPTTFNRSNENYLQCAVHFRSFAAKLSLLNF